MAPSLDKEPAHKSDHQRVEQALDEYLQALEQGEKPDRNAFLGRFPDMAESLGRAIDGLNQYQAALAQIHGPVNNTLGGLETSAETELPLQPLGDYRLRREIGRGGMGVVYEAEQLSLGRRVALKVLPFAAGLDPAHLRRFQLEAQMAGCLHHANIVPIHGMGCERGVHFYVMQFIEGRSLAEVVRERKQATEPEQGKAPTARPVATGNSPRRQEKTWFRTVAGLGLQAAEALAYAHAQGIVHRDVKPGNLLLETGGRLWIADFGLARAADRSGSTASTAVAGTLRYMSPEQALGQRDQVDGRSDVYSLGATLYELLTCQPPFATQDRQELLQQIVNQSRFRRAN
jgi:serine/threonine protein kinase